MTTRRRTTVYDLADLRLHPDGSRVQQSSESNLRAGARHSASTVQDSRGNWVASDAGGSARVVKRKKVSTRKTRSQDSDGEEIEVSGELPPLKHHSALKKIAFEQDMTFLDERPEPSQHELSPPSSVSKIPYYSLS